MRAARPQDDDNVHSASIQIDPSAQPAAPSTSGTPTPLPTHRLTYNDDDDDGGEEGPLLGAGSGGLGRHHRQPVSGDGEDGTGICRECQRRRSNESAPFLYRLHDWLADHGTKLDQNRWGKFLKWIFILLAVLFIQLPGLCRLLH